MNAVRFRSFAAFVSVATVAVYGIVADASAQTRTAFRVTSLGITDPQIFYPVTSPTACTGPLNLAVNGLVNSALGTCDPVTVGIPDPCTFDLNLVAVFDPLVQTAGADPAAVVECMSGGQPCELNFAIISECTRNAGAIACNGEPSAVVTSTYSNGGATATCLAGYPGTFGVNNLGSPMPTPATGNAMNNCGVSGLLELTIEIGDGLVTIPLKGAQIAARYNGNPAIGLTTGLARGFLSEEAANSIQIDVNQPPFVINAPLSDLLAGGENNCKTHAATFPQDDRDRNPPDSLDGERGWWFHLSFSATLVTAPEFPTPTATFTMVQADTPTPTPQPTDTQAPTNTPLPTDTPVPTATVTSTPVPTNTPAGVPCPGDCNGNGVVPISEVQLAANIYLEMAEVSACPAADVNNSGTVSISEVVAAGGSYRLDCPTQ